MISIITGDLIASRKLSPENWLGPLKEELSLYGNHPEYWEIYGGDTFQFRVDDPLNALLAAIRLKAVIKMIKPLDVRLSIGIGEISYKTTRINESNGPAFINSGEQFSVLKKKKKTLAIKSPWPDFDDAINLCLKLGTLFMNNWKFPSAEIINLRLKYPNATQEELGNIHGQLKQNAVSNRLQTAHYDELLEIDKFYKTRLIKLL